MRFEEQAAQGAGLLEGIQQLVAVRSRDAIAVLGLESREGLKKLDLLPYVQFLESG